MSTTVSSNGIQYSSSLEAKKGVSLVGLVFATLLQFLFTSRSLLLLSIAFTHGFRLLKDGMFTLDAYLYSGLILLFAATYTATSFALMCRQELAQLFNSCAAFSESPTLSHSCCYLATWGDEVFVKFASKYCGTRTVLLMEGQDKWLSICLLLTCVIKSTHPSLSQPDSLSTHVTHLSCFLTNSQTE